MAREIGARCVLIPTAQAVTALQREGFRDYPQAVRHGSTAHFNVHYSLPAATGRQIADSVLAFCERDYARVSRIFGGITPRGLPFDVVLAHLPQGGAYHYGAPATTLYCDVKLTPSVTPAYSRFLALAGLVEVFETTQGRGWHCGASNGEGLSRVLAAERYPRQIMGFATAATWLNHGRPDFVNRTNHTDRNPLSIGCAVLFLNYLHYQLKYRWRDIAAAAGRTLSLTYLRLTGDVGNPFPPFSALLAAKFPIGQPAVLATDNPFPIQPTLPRGPRPAARPARPWPEVPVTLPASPAGGPEEAAELDEHTAERDEGTSELAEVDVVELTEWEVAEPDEDEAGDEADDEEALDVDAGQDEPVPVARERTAGKFVGNKTSRIFHPATSPNLPSEDKRVYFDTAEEAIMAGFRPAMREGRANTKN